MQPKTVGSLGRGDAIPNALRTQTLNQRSGPRGNAAPVRYGFDRTIDGAVVISRDACVVVDLYVAFEPGGVLTLEPGAELLILGGP